jgi:hypothetical protein
VALQRFRAAHDLTDHGLSALGRWPGNFVSRPALVLSADYEHVIFGGANPDNGYGSDLRRMISMDVQGALRDAEKDLASWRHSPLRPLIESLTATAR